MEAYGVQCFYNAGLPIRTVVAMNTAIDTECHSHGTKETDLNEES